jgi:4-hydroxy-4-methyl-2-oxoglutarate aldolase
MSHPTPLQRLAALDTNTVSDALDLLRLPGATWGLRPLWDCPPVAGRASTIQLGPRRDTAQKAHLISPVIDAITAADRVLVISGGTDGVSCWGDILANAAAVKCVRGSVIDGYARDIEGSEALGYPLYGRGLTMVSARNRIEQVAAGVPVQVAGVSVRQDDYVLADRCGAAFVPQERIGEVLDLGERIASRQQQMIDAVRAGRPVGEVMHDREFAALAPPAH